VHDRCSGFSTTAPTLSRDAFYVSGGTGIATDGSYGLD
jgi:hypothetical protein